MMLGNGRNQEVQGADRDSPLPADLAQSRGGGPKVGRDAQQRKCLKLGRQLPAFARRGMPENLENDGLGQMRIGMQDIRGNELLQFRRGAGASEINPETCVDEGGHHFRQARVRFAADLRSSDCDSSKPSSSALHSPEMNFCANFWRRLSMSA